MKILITRPFFSSIDLVKKLRFFGKSAWYMPLFEFFPGDDLIQLPKKIVSLSKGDFLFAISQNAINFLHTTILSKKKWPNYLKYYAIGKTTGLKLELISHHPVKYPNIHPCSENLIKLLNFKKLKGKKALILCGDHIRNFLPKTLKSYGMKIIICKCYKRLKKKYNGSLLGKHWKEIGINTLLITSGEMLKYIYEIFSPEHKKWLLNCKLIVISVRLYKIAKNIGWNNIYVSKNADNDSLIKKIIFISNKN